MNDFLYAHRKTVKGKNGLELTIYLDANLKKNVLTVLRFEGALSSFYQSETEQIIQTFLNQNLELLPKIKLKNSLPLWLFYSAFEEFQGQITFKENKHDDLVCLCFGITQRELNEGPSPMLGRACGSCVPYLKKEEFKKIGGVYPGPLVVKLDDLIKNWSLKDKPDVSIEDINGDHLEVKLSPYNHENLKLLSDYFFEELKVRFFIRGTL
jgi:hypothetical protein